MKRAYLFRLMRARLAGGWAALMSGDCSIERSKVDNWRVALHEAGHTIVGRVLGQEVGGVTIVPGRTYSGLTWGPKHIRSELSDNDDRVPDFCATIARLMPGPGEPRTSITDIIAHSHHRAIELMAGTAAETVLHQDNPPWEAVSDLRQARGYASLVGCSDSAVDSFLGFALEQAIALVTEHRPLVLAIAKALVEHPLRTLTGAEIDSVIGQAVAVGCLATEQQRRTDWSSVTLSAKRFTISRM